MMTIRQLFLCILLFAGIFACKPTDTGPLPVIGNQTDLNGNVVEHKIRPFQLVNQLGDTIQNADLSGKVYVVDFFFTSCPSICPIVKKQMLRIYKHTEKYPDFLLLSHTIDPKRDSVTVLKNYADNLEIDHERWWFLTGEKDSIYALANEDYFIAALEAPDSPGGFDHSGKLILLDKSGRIRGFCEGTEPESVNGFMKTIDRLMKEYNND